MAGRGGAAVVSHKVPGTIHPVLVLVLVLVSVCAAWVHCAGAAASAQHHPLRRLVAALLVKDQM